MQNLVRQGETLNILEQHVGVLGVCFRHVALGFKALALEERE